MRSVDNLEIHLLEINNEEDKDNYFKSDGCILLLRENALDSADRWIKDYQSIKNNVYIVDNSNAENSIL